MKNKNGFVNIWIILFVIIGLLTSIFLITHSNASIINYCSEQEIPEECPTSINIVCGSDGTNYDNWCVACSSPYVTYYKNKKCSTEPMPLSIINVPAQYEEASHSQEGGGIAR